MKMKTINTVSGGKSSAYIAEHYPADFNVFSLVRVERPPMEEDRYNCLWMKGKDEFTRQLISDRIGVDFYGTAEEDTIIYTILDLEQHIGREIKIITGETFDHVIKHAGRCLPDPLRRFCTAELKMKPMFNWWRETINEPSVFRIGYREGEEKRTRKMQKKLNENGLLVQNAVIGSRECTRKKTSEIFTQNRWGLIEWQKPDFILQSNHITEEIVLKNWEDKPVRFAKKNNCVICFHQDLLFVRFRASYDESNMEVLKWAQTKEGVKHPDDVWNKANKKKPLTRMESIINSDIIEKLDIKEGDFSGCDSGFCGV
jgi:hypothetical protein